MTFGIPADRARGTNLGKGGLVFGCTLLAAALVACGGGGGSVPGGSAEDQGTSVPDVLATVGDQPITMEDIRAKVGEQLDQAEVEYLKTRHQTIESALQAEIRERVLTAEAEKQGQTLDELVESEAGRDLAPTDAEVTAWYETNRARLAGRPLEQLRSQIVSYLTAQRRQQVTQRLYEQLKDDWNVSVDLEPYRLPIDNTGAPVRGPDDALVTLTEFSDFQCPFCGRFTPTLERLREEMGDTLRVVFRHFPLPSLHPDAERAAEASLCAQEQGKFWEMHDLLFQEQNRLKEDDLREKAERLDLDLGAFDECMESDRGLERIREDQSAGRSIGVHGTPAVFVNGIEVEGGAVPYEVIAGAVRQEIERTNR